MPSLDAPTDPDRTDAENRAQSLLASCGAAISKWDPYLAPQLVVASAIALDLTLPKKVTIGPSWLLPAFEGLLLIGLAALTPHPKMRHSPARRYSALALIGLVSAVNIVSLVLLCHILVKGRSESGHNLILAGAVLWITNVLLFGLWFWQLDRGGPLARRASPEPPDFLFPQMTEPKLSDGWEPNLIDYLYVSFTNATAFSPTDAMPLSRTAKLLMAAQALTALVTVGLVVARAVNILNVMATDEDAVEQEIRRVGAELADAFPSAARHPMRAFDARAMELASSDQELKAALFRFVDVVPACRSLDDLARHLTGFLSEVPDATTPIAAAMRISNTKAGRAALGAAAAGGVRHMAHRFIVGETPQAALGVLRGLWNRGVASSVDLLGEATVTETEADAYAARCTGALEQLASAAAGWPTDPCSSTTGSVRCHARTYPSRSRR